MQIPSSGVRNNNSQHVPNKQQATSSFTPKLSSRNGVLHHPPGLCPKKCTQGASISRKPREHGQTSAKRCHAIYLLQPRTSRYWYERLEVTRNLRLGLWLLDEILKSIISIGIFEILGARNSNSTFHRTSVQSLERARGLGPGLPSTPCPAGVSFNISTWINLTATERRMFAIVIKFVPNSPTVQRAYGEAPNIHLMIIITVVYMESLYSG